MKLSDNFVLSEITHSNTAIRKGIDNAPTTEHLRNIQLLLREVVQPMRSSIGPIRISSGYRSPKLNRAIGGSSRSQHCKGEALDLQFWKGGYMNNKVMYDWILDNNIDFDQMINEFDFSWIHISYSENKNRRQVLEAYKNDLGKTAYRHAKDNIKGL
jgi:hypothetical protein